MILEPLLSIYSARSPKPVAAGAASLAVLAVAFAAVAAFRTALSERA